MDRFDKTVLGILIMVVIALGAYSVMAPQPHAPDKDSVPTATPSHTPRAPATVLTPTEIPTAIPTPIVTPLPEPEPTTSQQASVCANAEPLNHVYNPDRLVVLEPCKTVSGTVMKVIQEQDGDTHVRLNVDPQYSNTINQANINGQHGYLVLEIVCAYPVTQTDAIDACTKYTNEIRIPKVGEHIEVTGQFVSDSDHGGWNEIHPVYELKDV